jgi:hypothetical protein
VRVGFAHLSAPWRPVGGAQPVEGALPRGETVARRLRPACRLDRAGRCRPASVAGDGAAVRLVWIEIVWDGNAVPANIARLALAYSALTWLGMFCFGREAWLASGEVFAAYFGLLARLAPTEVRVRDPGVCAGCSARRCRAAPGDCVNCYECYQRRAGIPRMEPPPAAWIADPRPADRRVRAGHARHRDVRRPARAIVGRPARPAVAGGRTARRRGLVRSTTGPCSSLPSRSSSWV